MNNYVLSTYYEKYLREVKKLSESSIGHYTQALRKISSMLMEREKIEESIYKVQDINVNLIVNIKPLHQKTQDTGIWKDIMLFQ